MSECKIVLSTGKKMTPEEAYEMIKKQETVAKLMKLLTER